MAQPLRALINPDPVTEVPQLSVVIPCLNEAATLMQVIAEAWEGIAASGLPGEVVVADNGSTDGSQYLARRAGARLVQVDVRGYGTALQAGIEAARGEWVIFGDADLSYDFRQIPRFTEKLGEPCDLLLGSRFRGEIQPGAMPLLHRYLGTPVLNAIIFAFFGVRTSDCNSGMRLVRREFYLELKLRAAGMERATELVTKTALANGRYAEVPIVLRPDRRGRPSHLRTWRDGWRNLRSILWLSPNRLFLVPALAFAAAGIPIGLIGLFAPWLAIKLLLHAKGERRSRLVALLERFPAEWAFLAVGGALFETWFSASVVFIALACYWRWFSPSLRKI